jgi:putative acetyltransferase
MPDLIRPSSPAHWNEAGRLLREYAASLEVTLEFQDFDGELQHLPDEYGPPGGCFFLAEVEGAFVGCGALRRLSDTDCEMKRVYVSPTHQGFGLGRTLVAALIEEARALGYARMRLDTMPSMQRAQALYRSFGFAPTDAYRFNPVPGASFWSLDL